MEGNVWKVLVVIGALSLSGTSSLPHKLLTYNKAVELGVAIYNSKAGEDSCYRLLEAVPQPEWDPSSESNQVLNFTMKETMCPVEDICSLEECDFQEDGMVRQCRGYYLFEERPPVVVITCVTVVGLENEERAEEEEEEKEEGKEAEEKEEEKTFHEPSREYYRAGRELVGGRGGRRGGRGEEKEEEEEKDKKKKEKEEKEEEEEEDKEKEGQPRRVKRFKKFFKKIKTGIKKVIKKTKEDFASHFRW